MTGQRFGRLTVLYPTRQRDRNHDLYIACKCDCGNVTTVLRNNLKRRHTRSCGCLEQDCMKVNRQEFHGEQNGFAKLTDDAVREIRRLYAQGLLQREIGEMYSVSQRCISQIVRREHWRHVE